MMGPASFVLAILGCGEGQANCQPVGIAPARYESRAACLAATEDALARADVAYPVLVADCRAAGVQAASVRANEVRLPDPRGWSAPVTTASRGR